MHDKILILDFGSQVTQLIARRVREPTCTARCIPATSREIVRASARKGIILSGGPQSTYEAADRKAPQAVFELGVPVLGICYGMQTMAMQQGGRSRAARSANSVMPKCGPTAIPSCLKASRISAPSKAMACSRCG
jgi:GMP synthase (glutamine-hydrolysing)